MKISHLQIKQAISHYRHHKVGTFDRFVAAASAGACSQALIYPLEVVKVRVSLIVSVLFTI